MTLTAENALFGHTSEDTALLVDDYPYSWKLRTEIRYWIETTKKGDRFVSQTRNPKVAGSPWNKPRKSTYAPIGVMYRDGEGHVTWGSLHLYGSDEALAAFTAAVGDNLLPIQARTLEVITKLQAAMAARTAARVAQAAEAGA